MWIDSGEGVVGRQGFLREGVLRAAGAGGVSQPLLWQRAAIPTLLVGVRTTNKFLKPDVKPKSPF
jgi:hypothetical protein